MKTVTIKHHYKTQELSLAWEWWHAHEPGAPIKESHLEALNETANDKITAMLAEGFVEGELTDNIRMDDGDPEDGVDYRGYWNSEPLKDATWYAVTYVVNDKAADVEVVCAENSNDAIAKVSAQVARQMMESNDALRMKDGSYTFTILSVVKSSSPIEKSS